MSTPPSIPTPVSHAGPALAPVRLGAALQLALARRLVDPATADVEHAARTLVAHAPRHGIDLSSAWGMVEPSADGQRVRQAALGVIGAGRTMSVFVSRRVPVEAPVTGSAWSGAGWAGDDATQVAEASACVRALLDHVPRQHGQGVAMAQSLCDPADTWTARVLAAGGLWHLATLTDLRLDLSGRLPDAGSAAWPLGVRARPLQDLGTAGRPTAERRALLKALRASYVDTLDCPELCGLREAEDILESHVATGQHSPATWWLVEEGGEPGGCCLLTRTDERSAELVYLGLGPGLRGRGLAMPLLRLGLGRLGGAVREVRCAVDERNGPAMRLYARAGFAAVGSRAAWVVALSARAGGSNGAAGTDASGGSNGSSGMRPEFGGASEGV